MTWRFAAVGKHPAARDYFRVGDDFPLAGALAEWTGKGYPAVAVKEAGAAAMRSYRFWARAGQRDAIACGILRDSGDAVGRPYPLLVAGCGSLPGWESRWELLPLALEGAWAAMERLAARSFDGVAAFEEALRGLKIPSADWDGCKGAFDEALRTLPELSAFAPRPEDGRALPIDDGPGDDVAVQAARWSAAAKKRNLDPPGVVFMGGGLERTELFFFRRAIEPGDFSRLWAGQASSDGVTRPWN